MEDCFEIILSDCTDEATSCTDGCRAAQRNTNQHARTFERCEHCSISKNRSFGHFDIMEIVLFLSDPYILSVEPNMLPLAY